MLMGGHYEYYHGGGLSHSRAALLGGRPRALFSLALCTLAACSMLVFAEVRSGMLGAGVVPELRVQRVGEPLIEPDNNYSENTRIHIRLLYPSGHVFAGRTLYGYERPIRIEEWNTEIYDGLYGASDLPQTVYAPNGEVEITLKSLARYRVYDLRNMPVPQIAVIADGRTQLVQVPQWVDADGNDKTDWLEQRVDDILRRARASHAAEVADVVHALGDWKQSFRRDCGGFEETQPTSAGISAVCLDWDGSNAHRLNSNQELTATVLHEAHHVWVYRNPEQSSYKRRLLKASKIDQTRVQCVEPHPGLGDCAEHEHVWLSDPRYTAQEAAAEAFGQKYKHLFP